MSASSPRGLVNEGYGASEPLLLSNPLGMSHFDGFILLNFSPFCVTGIVHSFSILMSGHILVHFCSLKTRTLLKHKPTNPESKTKQQNNYS